MSADSSTISDGHRKAILKRKERTDNLRHLLHEWHPEPGSLTLEIGCGHGHYLTAFAQAHPDEMCLGVDLVTRRIQKALAKRDKRHLRNLNFIKADAWECLDALPEHLSLSRIFVLFPDPWPKKRHEKNRLLQHSLLDAIGKKAVPGALLHFRTDHEALFAWGVEQLCTHPRWQLDDAIGWPLEAGSFFQDLLGAYNSASAVFSAA